MADKDKGIVSFPEQDEYIARINAAKEKKIPLGGAPMPQMPRFDQPVQPDRHAGVQAPITSRHHILSPEQQDELKKQGQFIPGAGSAYAFNQPAAEKVLQPQPGVQKASEGQEYANPPRPSGAGLRQETLQQLEEIAKINAQPEAKKDATEEKKTAKPSKDSDDDGAVSELEDFEDQFDVDEFGQKVRNLLVNKERREAIEKRCSPMNIEDLLTNQEIRQTITLIPGKLEITFRSMTGAEDLYIKRKVFGVKGSTQMIYDTFSVLSLCCSLFSINRRPLPSHLDAEGDPDDERFEAKKKLLLKLPIQLLADFSVNYSWFDRRVKKLFVIDELKGF